MSHHHHHTPDSLNWVPLNMQTSGEVSKFIRTKLRFNYMAESLNAKVEGACRKGCFMGVVLRGKVFF